MSSGFPIRPIGVWATMASITFSGIAERISVAMKPGATALTLILNLPSSRAHVLVIVISPPLVAA